MLPCPSHTGLAAQCTWHGPKAWGSQLCEDPANLGSLFSQISGPRALGVAGGPGGGAFFWWQPQAPFSSLSRLCIGSPSPVCCPWERNRQGVLADPRCSCSFCSSALRGHREGKPAPVPWASSAAFPSPEKRRKSVSVMHPVHNPPGSTASHSGGEPSGVAVVFLREEIEPSAVIFKKCAFLKKKVSV